MLDPRFSEAFVHRPGGHTILGRTLHPLCALDMLALEAINCPFLVDGGRVEIADLVLAVWILSNPHNPDCTVSHLELDADGEAWLDKITPTIDMKEDCARMQKYIEDYWSLPEMMRTIAENPLTPYGCPWMMSRVITVCRAIGVSWFEGWTMGIGQLIWICCSIEEMDNSDSRIVSPEIRAMLDAAKNSHKVYTQKAGESDEDFAARIGIPVENARILMRGRRAAKHGR